MAAYYQKTIYLIFVVIVLSQVFLKKLSPSFYIDKRPSTRILFSEKSLEKLHESFLFGKRANFKNELKSAFQRLNILHLATPSCLHLNSLFLILLFFKKKKWPKIIICSFIYLAIFDFQSMYSLKRACLLIAARELLPKHYFKMEKTKVAFLLVFIFDFLWGSYLDAPLSFWLSFVYLYIFIFNPLPVFPYSTLIITQAFISMLFFRPFNLLGSTFGMLVTALFTFIFPLGMLNELTSYIISFDGISILLRPLRASIIFLSRASSFFPEFFISIPFLLFLILIFEKKYLKFAPLLLLIHSEPLTNLETNRLQKIPGNEGMRFLSAENIPFKKLQFQQKSIKTTHQYKVTCRLSLYNSFWVKKCTTPKAKSRY